eukprot:SAG31_NODE_1289_length_8983_cov_9.783543_3_plen_75_part_00
MMRVMTDFRRMRFGLGVTLMTDSYFAMDIGQLACTQACSTRLQLCEWTVLPNVNSDAGTAVTRGWVVRSAQLLH